MRFVATLFCALLLTACATTAPHAPVPETVPPTASAPVLFTAEGVIQQSNAQQHFRPETSDDSAYVQARSIRSGLRCRFETRSGGSITIFPARAGSTAPGDDVGCNTPSGPTYITLYATRYAAPTTVDAELEDAVVAIRERFQVLADIAPTTAERAGARTQIFKVNQDGVIKETRVSVAMVDGWVLKLRFTAPTGALPQADALWADVLADFEGAGRAARPGV